MPSDRAPRKSPGQSSASTVTTAAGALVDVGREGAVGELAAALSRLLSDEGDRRHRGEAGHRALGTLRGAAARTATRVLGLLAAR